ncbi:unnamed protein product [Parajaminaea phylloscopi]
MPDIARAAWLQAMLARRAVTDSECRALHKTACSAARVDYDAGSYDEFIHEASVLLGPTGLEIRRMVDEWTDKQLVAIVNTNGDELAQLATSYTPQELSLIRTWIEAIFTQKEYKYSIGTTDALNLTPQIKPPMTKKAAQDLLARLCRHNWLRKSPRGQVSLTSRALLELRSLLKADYPDYAIECAQCHNLVTRGAGCNQTLETEDEGRHLCEARVHYLCQQQLPGFRQDRATCPACKSAWQPIAIGDNDEEEVSMRDASEAHSQGVPGGDEEDGDEDEDDEDADRTQVPTWRPLDTRTRATSARATSSGARNPSAAKRRRTSGRIAQSAEADEDEDEDE